MSHLNVEIKARCNDLNQIRQHLLEQKIVREKTVRQIDTYFYCTSGKLKLRETLEKNEFIQSGELIHYQRELIAGPKKSMVTFYYPADSAALKNILMLSNGIQVVVDKQREIYWSTNVKIHLDEVARLGSFLEIEAIDFENRFDVTQLDRQCRHFLELFQVAETELLIGSYSDLLLALNSKPNP